jgi:predicted DNA repair protein MutK
MLAASHAVASVSGPLSGFTGWLAGAVVAGVLGLIVGWIAALGIGLVAKARG